MENLPLGSLARVLMWDQVSVSCCAYDATPSTHFIEKRGSRPVKHKYKREHQFWMPYFKGHKTEKQENRDIIALLSVGACEKRTVRVKRTDDWRRHNLQESLGTAAKMLQDKNAPPKWLLANPKLWKQIEKDRLIGGGYYMCDLFKFTGARDFAATLNIAVPDSKNSGLSYGMDITVIFCPDVPKDFALMTPQGDYVGIRADMGDGLIGMAIMNPENVIRINLKGL